jgi:SSS family solute:Na+ symporter
MSTTPQDFTQAVHVFGRLDYFSFFFNIEKNAWIAFSFVLAWVVSPIAWQRIQAARDVKSARQGLAATSIALFLMYGIIVGIGLLSMPILSGGETGESVLSVIIATKTGNFFGGILFVAVVAAIMSTMDTALNTGALSMTHDLYSQFFPQKKTGHVIFVSRISTVFVTLLAFFVATRFQSILKTLGLASEIMAVGFFVPGVAMVYLKKKWPFAGFLSLVLGLGFALVGFFCEIGLFAFHWPEWPFSVPYGVGLSLTGFFVGMIIDKIMGRPLDYMRF